MLAYTATTWTQVIVGASIFVPVAVTIWLCFVFLRGQKDDPDEQRLRRAQKEYEERRNALSGAQPGRPARRRRRRGPDRSAP